MILRPEGRVFFLNAQSIADQINSFIAKYKPEVLLLDLSRVPDLEYSALKMLIEGDQRLTSQGGIQWFSAMNPNVLKVVRNSAWIQNLEGRLFFNADLAIQRYLETRKDRAQSSSLAFNHGSDQARSASL
ncbi:STAS domain protein [compost metagenome]